MSSLDTQNLITPAQTSAPQANWNSPAWAPAQPTTSAEGSGTSLSDEQRTLDEAAAAEAGMGATEVATLGSFGLRPSEMDPAAGERMAVGLKRMQALLACEGGNEVGCELAGPGLVGHQTYEGVGGDTSEDLVVEDEAFTLRLSTRTTADGQTERVLFYEDIDGNYLSGVSAEPVEGRPEQQPPAEEPPTPDEEGLGSFLEGALLGDFADNDTWSAVAGQTTVGLIPIVGQIADARDTLAAVRDVAEGQDGAWARLSGAAVGWIPGIGDALKGGTRVGMRLGTEVVEEGAERLVKETVEEGAERLAREEADEGAEQLAKEGAETAEERAARDGTEEGAEQVVAHTSASWAPDPTATPAGRRTQSSPNASADRVRSDIRENEAADTLAQSGYDIEQNPSVPGSKRPDYRIEGKIFDNIAPKTDNPRSIWSRAKDKIDEQQTERVVLNLDDSAVDIDVLRAQFADWPIEGLQEVLVVRGGQVIPLFP